MQENGTKSPAPRRCRLRARIAGLALLCLVAAAGLGAVFMVGRPVDAPGWVRERIEARLAESLPGLTVDFGRMSLLVQRSGLPRIILWDVEISNPQGARVAELSDIEAGISPSALLAGRIELREAQVSGAFVTLRRDPQGRIGLALGDAFAAGTDMPDIGDIVARVDAVLSDPRLSGLTEFSADALTLRYEDQRARRGWTADGGRLDLTRTGNDLRLAGDVAVLSGGDGVATVEIEAASPIGARSLSFGVILHGLASRDIATQSPALAWLDDLDAPISGSLRSAFDEEGALAPLQATLEIGAGVLQPTRDTRALHFDAAETRFSYTPGEELLRFDRIRIASPLGQVEAAGTARLTGIETDGWPEALTGQFTVTGLALAEGALLERGIEISGAETAFKLDLDPFEFTLGELRVTDPGYPVRASGKLSAEPGGWRLALDAHAVSTTPDQALSFWPAGEAAKARRWVTNNVKSGVIEDLHFSLRAEPGAEEPRTYIDFGFAEGVSTYNPNLPGLTGAAGRLTIFGGRLGLRLAAGTIDAGGGPIDVAGTEFVIADLKAQPAVGEIRLAALGSVTAALHYLNNDAWRLVDKADRTLDVATGEARLSGRIAMPLMRGLELPDVALDLRGRLRNVDAPTAIPGKPLVAEDLDLTVTSETVAIAGAVEVQGVPASGRWQRPLQGDGGTVTADVTVTPRTLDALGIPLPRGLLDGEGFGQLRIDLPRDAAPRFSLESDLAGLGLSVPALGWSLARPAKGLFTVAGELGEVPRIDRMTLFAAGLEAEGRVLLRDGGGFDRLEFSRLTVGDWLDVRGRLVNRGGQAMPAIEIDDGRIDMRSAPFTSSSGAAGTGEGNGGGPGGGSPLVLTLDSLRLTDSIIFDDFSGAFDTTRGLNGRFEARLGGRTPVQGVAVPQQSGIGFRLTGEDAGDVLRAAGLLKTVSDGTFRLDLGPVPGQPGHYDGFMRIEGTRLQGAPGIAALLDAVSIVGLIDQLNGPGIFFAEVEARFRLTPSRVIVSRSSAVGPSMGISLDGYYDLASGQMDMQGVLSPIYIVNGIGRLISRQGEGLIGFNFNLRGPAREPRVSVNPLSAFTPGMFRDIFRRPPPKLSQ